MKRSKADKANLWIWAWNNYADCIADWQAEYRFLSDRRFRFDWALPTIKIAVERDGRYYAVAIGSHTQDTDYWKRAYAAAEGWIVFAFTYAGNHP